CESPAGWTRLRYIVRRTLKKKDRKLLMLTDFVVTAPEGRNVYSFVDEKPPSSDRSDICRPDIAPLGLGKYFAYKTINISPPLGLKKPSQPQNPLVPGKLS